MKQTQWCVPCLRGQVGDWIYYSALMRAEQLELHVDTSKNIRESDALDDFLQRTLKERYKNISKYLLNRDDRFFNSIIVGVFDGLPDWVQFDLSPMAEKLGAPQIEAAEDSLGLLLFFGGEKMFALDGQHRIEGIKDALKENPERIKNDEYSVIFVAHKDDKKGKVRTRRLFSDINNNAVKVSGGDKVIIDEDDLSAIVTRRIYAEHPLFKGGEEIALTEQKEQLIEADKERFTSLLALYTVTQKLKPLFRKPKDTLPNEAENVSELQKIVADFWDFAAEKEPSLNQYFHSGDVTPESEREKNKNLFFRPVGLELLSRLYTQCHKDEKLDKLANALIQWQFNGSGGIWDGLVWKNGKIDASAKARNAAFQLCLYYMDEAEEVNPKLLGLIREVRNNPNYELPLKSKVPTK